MRSPKWNMPVDAATLPASVKSWLGQQLELRGIDAVIYTRYILSILQQDGRDVEPKEPELFRPPGGKRTVGSSREAGRAPRAKSKSRRPDKRGSREVDVEELKKTAAVECLMSVTDEDSGIENLVEELCLRLKEQKLFNREVATVEAEDKKLTSEQSDGNDSVLSSSPEDPAERYYAAFPPLSDEQVVKPKTIYPEGCVWSKLAQKTPGSGHNSDDGEPPEMAVNQNIAESGTATSTAATDDKTPEPLPPESGKVCTKTKISKLDVRLTKPDRGKKKYSPGGSPRGRHTPKNRRGSPAQLKRQYQQAPPQWLEDLEAVECPTFFVPKVKTSTTSKAKLLKITATHDGRPFEVPDTDEARCLWLMQILERNKRQHDLEQQLSTESCFAEVQNILDGQDDDSYDLNLSILYGQEDQSWYTKPIDDFLAPSPVPTQRLYKRRSDADTVHESDESDGEATEGAACVGDKEEISEIALEKLQAILMQLLSPKGETKCIEVNSCPDCITPDHHPDQSQDVKCQCGNYYNNNEGEPTSLPVCHCSTQKSGTSSPIELASRAIPVSTENEVPDDRPGTVELTDQLCKTLSFLEEHEAACGCSDSDTEPSTACTPHVNSQPNLSGWSDGLDTSAELREEDDPAHVLGTLPTGLHSQLTYNICDSTTSNNNVWLDELNWAVTIGTGGCVTMQGDAATWPEELRDGGPPTWAGYLSPQKEPNRMSTIWDVNHASRRQLDFDTHPRERSNTMERVQRSLLHLDLPGGDDAAEAEFIEGGLYGSDWNSTTSPSINVLDVGTPLIFTEPDPPQPVDMVWEDFCLNPVHFCQRSSSTDDTCLSEEDSCSSTQDKPPSTEITPSANSAFQDLIPPRMYHLQHVHSEPILSPSKMARRLELQQEISHRLVQIKHLYKSDTNILKELGLASGSDYEEVDQKAELEISPDRHFKPIISPVASIQTIVPLPAPAPAPPGYDTAPSKADNSSSLSSSNRSGYQLYCSEETESASDLQAFIPRFKVVKECDKSAQTGEEAEEEEETIEDDMELTERLLDDMNSMLEEDDEEDECPSFTVQDIVDSSVDHSPVAMVKHSHVYTLQELPKEAASALQARAEELVNLWTDEEEELVVEEEEDVPGANPQSAKHAKSIWSCGTQLDIPSLPGSFSCSDWSTHNTWSSGGAQEDLAGAGIEGLPRYLDHVERGEPQGQSEPEPEWLHAEPDEVFLDEFLDYDSALFPFESSAVPHCSALYSSDLEEQWLSKEQPFEVQVPKRKPRPKKGPSRKPCSFFMEGSCRRTDCKFAHDMSSITCRFWEEGECFKGITCPFLHGYPGESPDGRTMSADGQTLSDFSLESDDFPELVLQNDDKGQTLSIKFGAGEQVTSAIRKLNQLNSAEKPRVAFASQKGAHQAKQKMKSVPIDIKSKSK